MVVVTCFDTHEDIKHIEFNLDNTVTLHFEDKSIKDVPVEEILHIKEKE